jgi:hypothetical protein
MHSQVRIFSVALSLALAGGLAVTEASYAQTKTPQARPVISYTADGKLQYPADYRTWVYLSSGLDMAYTDAPGMNHHMFDNVFVNREAYDAYQKTGTWPDKTIFMLEARMAEPKASINKQGLTQTAVMGREAHVKDTARFSSGWAFFPFTGEGPSGPAFPQTSNCNQCHEQHGAVDTTFVQFYPTLISKAQEKKTFSAAYLAEEAKPKDEKR